LFGAAAEDTAGTVTVSGTAVTGASTAFTDTMVGCVFRPSSSASLPTGKTGRRTLDNPYPEQRLVVDVTDATHLTLSSSMTGTYGAGSKYSIGAPLDIEIDVMLDVFLRRAELQYAMLVAKSPEQERRLAAFTRALHLAMGADYREGPIDGNQNTSADWLSRPNLVVNIGSSA
jgi:hypothetical protein